MKRDEVSAGEDRDFLGILKPFFVLGMWLGVGYSTIKKGLGNTS